MASATTAIQKAGPVMRVLLINPPCLRFLGTAVPPPLGLLYVASVLREAGVDVVVYDGEQTSPWEALSATHRPSQTQLIAGYEAYLKAVREPNHSMWRRVRRVIDRVAPDVVGIGFSTFQHGAAVITAQIAKRLSPHRPVIVGGVHPTVLPEETARQPSFDVVVRGEGELSFREIIRLMERHRTVNIPAIQDALLEVAGLSFRHRGTVVSTKATEHIEPLDQLPFPARDLLLFQRRYVPWQMGTIMTGRGCPNTCTFCCAPELWNRRVRYREPENVVREIEQMRRRYGTREFTFIDDTFMLKRSRTVEICRRIRERNLDIVWSCNTRVDTVEPAVLSEMKKAGCFLVKVGVESGSQRILAAMKKGVTLEQTKKACRQIRAAGIQLQAFTIIGYPGETEETIRATQALLEELAPEVAGAGIITPYPGTELYRAAVRDNTLRANSWSELSPCVPTLEIETLSREQILNACRDERTRTDLAFDDALRQRLKHLRYVRLKIRESLHSPRQILVLGSRLLRLLS